MDKVQIYLGAAIIVVIAMIGLALYKYTHMDVAPSVPPEDVVTVDQALTAMVRGHPHSTKICYDEKINAFFVLYPAEEWGTQTQDNVFHGWYFVEKIKFYLSANGTRFITNIPESSYVSVFPDTTNLPCKANIPASN